MAISKVILNGDTLMDVTSNTVTAETLKTGYTATKNDGTSVTGTFYDGIQDLIEGKPSNTYLPSSHPAFSVLSTASRIFPGKYMGINFIYYRNISLLQAQYISSYAFYGCAFLTSVYAPSCGKIDQYAFTNDNSITTLSFPVCSYIGSYAFSSCKSLANINFPQCSYIGQAAFQFCNALQTINLPICSEIQPQTFESCWNLTSIDIPNCIRINQSAFAHCSKLTSISLPQCSSIYSHAFYDCYQLSSVVLGSTYTRIDFATFRGCSQLSSFDFTYITSISSYAFCECNFLSLTFSNITNPSFLSGNTFQSNLNLSFVYLNNTLSTKSSVNIYATFINCSRLLSLYLLGTASYYNGYNSTFLSGTPISNETTYTNGIYGSIYVPASLYSMYISARGWSQYSARIVSLTDSEIAALNFV